MIENSNVKLNIKICKKLYCVFYKSNIVPNAYDASTATNLSLPFIERIMCFYFQFFFPIDLPLTFKSLTELVFCFCVPKSAYVHVVHSGQKCFIRVACLWSKMAMFQRAGMREGGKPLPLAFQYLIIMI